MVHRTIVHKPVMMSGPTKDWMLETLCLKTLWSAARKAELEYPEMEELVNEPATCFECLSEGI